MGTGFGVWKVEGGKDCAIIYVLFKIIGPFIMSTFYVYIMIPYCYYYLRGLNLATLLLLSFQCLN